MSAQNNQLGQETSPYLLQHADNPVHWHAWNEEALASAREQGKPILLSIGYSACHWCHVMAHESFEDPETARLMNELYVNIKVDREERPDLDKVYQLSQQLLVQRAGGWPLTMFLTPDDLTPFFGGTYFPPEPRHGLPGFRDVLQQVSDAYHAQREVIREQGVSLKKVLAQISAASLHEGALDDSPIRAARATLQEQFDPIDGGFGGAPKFPHAEQLQFLLDYARVNDDPEARHMAVFTLEKMALGGIFDQIAGGFCRYSVDAHWNIPHFEKMLYDNGPLLALYAREAADSALFDKTARMTADWALQEMRSPEGAFWSSLDADSEGVEGKFYVWDRDEVAQLLSPETLVVADAAWGLDRAPNFENSHWHLHRYQGDAALAEQIGMTEPELSASLEEAAVRLLAARSQRIRPGLDDKILTSWNALMIRGLAVAGRCLAETRYLDAAEQALGFLRREQWRDGRLYASWKDGRSRFPAYLDDYAFVLDAGLELLQCRWDTDVFTFVLALADALLDDFLDKEHGGFFFTAHNHEALIQRSRPLGDEATPSGNGIAALALQRLGHLAGDARYLDAAAGTLKVAWEEMQRAPAVYSSLLGTLKEHLNPPTTVILRGTEKEMKDWREAMDGLPAEQLRFAIPATEKKLPGSLGATETRPGGVAYLCQGNSCSPPMETPGELAKTLSAS